MAVNIQWSLTNHQYYHLNLFVFIISFKTLCPQISSRFKQIVNSGTSLSQVLKSLEDAWMRIEGYGDKLWKFGFVWRVLGHQHTKKRPLACKEGGITLQLSALTGTTSFKVSARKEACSATLLLIALAKDYNQILRAYNHKIARFVRIPQQF